MERYGQPYTGNHLNWLGRSFRSPYNTQNRTKKSFEWWKSHKHEIIFYKHKTVFSHQSKTESLIPILEKSSKSREITSITWRTIMNFSSHTIFKLLRVVNPPKTNWWRDILKFLWHSTLHFTSLFFKAVVESGIIDVS